MIKIKSFKIGVDEEEAGLFMEEHPPRSTDKQSGMFFQQDNIVIMYDDGKTNEKQLKDKLAAKLDTERNKMSMTKHELVMAQKALERIKPVGYVLYQSDTATEKMLEDQGMKDYKERKSIVEQIANLENEIKMDTHEIGRIGYEIEAYEFELAELNK